MKRLFSVDGEAHTPLWAHTFTERNENWGRRRSCATDSSWLRIGLAQLSPARATSCSSRAVSRRFGHGADEEGPVVGNNLRLRRPFQPKVGELGELVFAQPVAPALLVAEEDAEAYSASCRPYSALARVRSCFWRARSSSARSPATSSWSTTTAFPFPAGAAAGVSGGAGALRRNPAAEVLDQGQVAADFVVDGVGQVACLASSADRAAAGNARRGGLALGQHRTRAHTHILPRPAPPPCHAATPECVGGAGDVCAGRTLGNSLQQRTLPRQGRPPVTDPLPQEGGVSSRFLTGVGELRVVRVVDQPRWSCEGTGARLGGCGVLYRGFLNKTSRNSIERKLE